MNVSWGECHDDSGPAGFAFGPESQAGPRWRRQSVRLVIAEEGTSGLEAQAPPDGGHQTVVIAQGPGEPPAELALRAVRRISLVDQAQRSVERLIMLLAPRFDAEAMRARLLIARALMTHSAVANGGSSELLLSAGNTPWPRLKEELFTLVDALKSNDGWSLPIRLQLPRDDSPPLSTPRRVSPPKLRRLVATRDLRCRAKVAHEARALGPAHHGNRIQSLKLASEE